MVTLNYRLNLFGFLAHPALDAEGHLADNYGILDQQAVLHWVQRNIAAFGGDPSRVALGGQSAGAQDTGVNQISPLSAGLFNRAIYESAPCPALRSIGRPRNTVRRSRKRPVAVRMHRPARQRACANCRPPRCCSCRHAECQQRLHHRPDVGRHHSAHHAGHRVDDRKVQPYAHHGRQRAG